MDLLFEDLTSVVIKAYYKVYNTLGYGFLEKVYENAMGIELTKAGIQFQRQYPIDVYYAGINIGHYYADLYISNQLIVELKAAESLCEEHECQLINYLRATDVKVGLLMNFGKKCEFRRKIFQNSLKKVNFESK